jgi:hypothetical protein
MDDFLPADPRARRLAIIVWTVGAVVGTIAVWWVSGYVDQLTELGRTDRHAALGLFRTRVLPVLLIVVLISTVTGAMVLRYGLRMVHMGLFPPTTATLARPASQVVGKPARVIGAVIAASGFILAALPLVLLSMMLWMLRNA